MLDLLSISAVAEYFLLFITMLFIRKKVILKKSRFRQAMWFPSKIRDIINVWTTTFAKNLPSQ